MDGVGVLRRVKRGFAQSFYSHLPARHKRNRARQPRSTRCSALQPQPSNHLSIHPFPTPHPDCYNSLMSVIASVKNPNARRFDQPVASPSDACARIVTAKLVSLNGGIVLSLCILVTTIALAMALAAGASAPQTILFILLTFASWVYLVDGCTEKLILNGSSIVLTSAIGAPRVLNLAEVRSLVLRHEGFNATVGVESITVTTVEGKRSRLPLGPCWRHRELESFLSSVTEAMGYSGVVDVQA